MAENLLWRKDHIIFEICCLPHFAVYPRYHIETCAFFEELWANQRWPNRCEAIECFGKKKLAATVFLELEKSARQVIPDSVTQDEVLGVFRRDIAAVFRCDEYKLALG